MKRDFNPMNHPNDPVNASAGQHMGKKSPAGNKGGAGSLMGATIAPGYLVTGKGSTLPTGGLFRKANTAKRSKGSKTSKLKGF
jgi:hypothetical protein